LFNKKYIYITLGIGILFLVFKKKKGQFIQLINENGTLISVNNQKQVNLIIIYGGINYATPDFMYKQLNKSIIDNNLIFIVPFNYNFNRLNIEIKKFTDKNNINIKKTSIIGFSAGGHIVQQNYNKNFNFVGLIDPSTSPNYLNQNFSNNVYMIFNDNGWGGYPVIKNTLPLLNDKINLAGGKSEKILKGHSEIPAIFFNKYENNLTN